MVTDTIVAIATPPGRGAIGVVRVSGPLVVALTQAVCGRPLVPRVATHLSFLDENGQPIDEGLAIFFGFRGAKISKHDVMTCDIALKKRADDMTYH